MSLFAVIIGNIVDGVAIADSPLDVNGQWICIDNLDPKPGPGWSYSDGLFTAPPPPPPPPELPPVKTEEEKIADAVAAAVAKLIADGVLKQ